MIPLELADVARIVRGEVAPVPEVASGVVTSVTIDSRAVAPGSLFVALPGEHVDGHAFLADAARQGAVAALVSRPVPDARLPLVQVPDVATALADLAREVLTRLRAAGDVTVVGITGSVGKTTTKDLLSVLLGHLGPVVAPVASFNNEIGLPLTVLRADADTRVLVLEMGADAPGNLTFLTSVAPPDVAAVLVVGRAHLHGFGSIEGVAATKAELVQGLVPGGVAVLNADDHRVSAMATHADRVVAFGTDPDAAVRAEHVTTDDDGRAAFDLVAPQGRAQVRLALVGAHHVTNALAAAAVALELGVPLPDVAATLASTGPISPHRMHVVDTPGGVRVVDDAYNANPDSMRAALRTLADMALQRRRSIAVLGEMRELGPDSVREHDAVGALVAELGIDRLVVVGRGALAVHTAATHARDWQGESTWVETVADAVALLSDELRPDDVVLVKSSNGAGLLQLADAIVSPDGASA